MKRAVQVLAIVAVAVMLCQGVLARSVHLKPVVNERKAPVRSDPLCGLCIDFALAGACLGLPVVWAARWVGLRAQFVHIAIDARSKRYRARNRHSRFPRSFPPL